MAGLFVFGGRRIIVDTATSQALSSMIVRKHGISEVHGIVDMMAIIVRLLFTGILLTGYCHGQTVRPEIARLAADIAADHFHVSEHIGFGGSTTD